MNTNIKLTYQYGMVNMDFLDISLQVDEHGYIHTDLYRTKTAVNALRHAESSHPLPLISSIPMGQFIRAKGISSNYADFEKQSIQLKNRFEARGYQRSWIEAGYKRKVTVTNCLWNGDNSKQHREMRQAMAKYWEILRMDPILNHYIPGYPEITYKNLRDLLIRSHHQGNQPDSGQIVWLKRPKMGQPSLWEMYSLLQC